MSKAAAKIIPAARKRNVTTAVYKYMPIVRIATRGSNNMTLTIASDPGLLNEAVTKDNGA